MCVTRFEISDTHNQSINIDIEDMKLRHILGLCLGAFLAASCSENEVIGSMDVVKLSSTFAAIPSEGGEIEITVEAKGEWKLDSIITKISKNKTGGKDTTWLKKPDWITVTPSEGAAGVTTMKVSAAACAYGREAELPITCNGKVQYLKVRQGSMEASMATCADVIAGADGKSFRVKGTVAAITQNVYGNWILQDNTGQITIWGTLDNEGKTKNFSYWNMEVGDVVEVVGPKKTHNGTVELTDVTVISIEKWMAKLIGEDITMDKQGGNFDVKIAYKGSGCILDIPEDCKGWISYNGQDFIPGIPSKLEQNPADTAIVHLICTENTSEGRSATLNFTSEKYDANKKGVVSTTVKVKVSQEGSVRDVTCAEFLTLDANSPAVRITGVISKIKNDQWGNIYIKDATGEVYVHGVLTPEGEKQQFASLGLNEGCVVTVQGNVNIYNGAVQMKDSKYISQVHVDPISLADFKNLPDDPAKSKYYYIEGTVIQPTEPFTKFDLQTYGNFGLTDGITELYIYGCSTGWNGETKKFGTLGVNEGDLLKVLATKNTYKGLVQGVAVYVSHTPATPTE